VCYDIIRMGPPRTHDVAFFADPFIIQKGRNRMNLEMRRPSDLTPYENNPRKNDGAAVDKVASSIKNFGFKVPIVVDTNGGIVAGHTRHKAALRLELDEVPVVVADDLTPAQIKAFRIADNRVSEESEWDLELLSLELDSLDDIFTGFDVEEVDDIVKDPIEPEEKELKPYKKVHYLISLDINDNDKVLEVIEELKEMEGVEIESTLN